MRETTAFLNLLVADRCYDIEVFIRLVAVAAMGFLELRDIPASL